MRDLSDATRCCVYNTNTPTSGAKPYAYFYLIQEMLIQIFLSINAYKCQDMHVPSDYNVPSD